MRNKIPLPIYKACGKGWMIQYIWQSLYTYVVSVRKGSAIKNVVSVILYMSSINIYWKLLNARIGDYFKKKKEVIMSLKLQSLNHNRGGN